MDSITTIIEGFIDGFNHPKRTRKNCVQQDKRTRARLNEDRFDEMLKDSFPASDPVAMY